MPRFLIVDSEGEPLAARASVRIREFTSSPEGDGTDRVLKPYTADVEQAISDMVHRDGSYEKWVNGDEPRRFIVVPLEDAYTVNVKPKSQVEVQSSGSLP